MEQAEESAASIRKAFKGLGTDESRLIKEITRNSNGQRQLIKKQYFTMYGKQIEEDCEKELSGKFKKGVLALLEPTDEFEARHLHDAISGMGTDENTVIQILCSKEAHEIEILRAAYHRQHGKDLDEAMRGEEGGKLGRIFRSIAAGNRAEATDDSDVDCALAEKEAQELYDAGAGKFGTDESEFVRILCSRSFAQLRATFSAYELVADHTIEKDIKKEMSGDLERACLAIARSAISKSAYYARQVHAAMEGMGTKDEDLIRLLVTRSEQDMEELKASYRELYDKELYKAVKSELSGDYEKLFLSLIGKD